MKDSDNATVNWTDSDVATVLALLPVVREYRKAIENAMPAAERLEESGYPGVADVVQELAESLVDDGLTEPSGAPGLVLRNLELMERAAGIQAAWDFEWYGKYLKGTSDRDEAAKAMVEAGEDFDRVEAMRQYAATVA